MGLSWVVGSNASFPNIVLYVETVSHSRCEISKGLFELFRTNLKGKDLFPKKVFQLYEISKNFRENTDIPPYHFAYSLSTLGRKSFRLPSLHQLVYLQSLGLSSMQLSNCDCWWKLQRGLFKINSNHSQLPLNIEIKAFGLRVIEFINCCWCVLSSAKDVLTNHVKWLTPWKV